MVYPKQETQCVIFGANDLAWNKRLRYYNYAWVMWRHYKGCIPGVVEYIGSIDF